MTERTIKLLILEKKYTFIWKFYQFCIQYYLQVEDFLELS